MTHTLTQGGRLTPTMGMIFIAVAASALWVLGVIVVELVFA